MQLYRYYKFVFIYSIILAVNPASKYLYDIIIIIVSKVKADKIFPIPNELREMSI